MKTKSEAREQFGSYTAMARALGISNQAVYMWPEQLSQRQADELMGAAVRLGKVTLLQALHNNMRQQ